MDEIIRDLNSISVGEVNNTFQMIAYAGDVILVSENGDDLQRLLF